MVNEIEVMVAGEDGWSDWIHPLPGYIMACCDCGLTHEMQTAIIPARMAATPEGDAPVTPTSDGEDADHVIVFRMRR